MGRIRGILLVTRRETDQEGFGTWLRTQADRHKGYVLNGKFLTRKRANDLARDRPELIERMREATRINGKITVL